MEWKVGGISKGWSLVPEAKVHSGGKTSKGLVRDGQRCNYLKGFGVYDGSIRFAELLQDVTCREDQVSQDGGLMN